MVTIEGRKYYIMDIHPKDRKIYIDYIDYHAN
jgi:hypothetical protein